MRLENLDDLLFLNQEGADDALFDALVAKDTPVRALDRLLAVAQPGALRRPGRLDSTQFALALATSWDLLGLLYILVDQAAARGSHSVIGRKNVDQFNT